MDWTNERYVRLFTRDTPEWLCMEWQGRALWPLLLRKLDRSGVLATKLGNRGIAVMVGLPVEVVEVGMAELLADGCIQPHQLGFVVPNFIEAQETRQSDAQRQRASREHRRSVTNRDSGSQNVTESHQESPGVTTCHSEPCLAEPSRAVLSRADLGENASASPPPPEQQSEPTGGSTTGRKKAARTGPRKGAQVPLPGGWQPRPQETAKAMALGLSADVEAERFRNHHTAKGTVFASWDAAFRTWLDKAPGFASSPRFQPKPKSALELQLERVEMLEARDRAERREET